MDRRNFLKNVGLGTGAMLVAGMIPSGILPLTASGQLELHEKIFGITSEDMRKLLEIALSKGGDFSELYFEYTTLNNMMMQDDILKSSSESVIKGVGVRVLKDEQTGYGFTNELTFDKIRETALAAAAIADGNAKAKVAALNNVKLNKQVYDLNSIIADSALDAKIKLISGAYNSALKHDNRIIKVTSSLGDSIQFVTIANSEGLIISDLRPQVRLVVNSTAESNGKRGTGNFNQGGRIGFDFFTDEYTPEFIGKKASEEALILLEADNAPAGEMPVVLSKDQSGVMIHEAVGHPLEADGNWKGQSIMSDKMGKDVANPIVTIYDDATIPNYRGSLNVDDEGVHTENVMLIEKGKLVGYLHDKLSAKMMNTKSNGHGRRESYMNPPIPRMNNTVLEKGDTDPEDIIKSVKKGFYAVSYQGGQVQNTGKFTFSVNLGYLIEDGKLTKPLRNATLIGSNIDIMKDVDMLGNDTGFFLGNCGKAGQTVPVTCGTPTLRIKKMTVGGVV